MSDRGHPGSSRRCASTSEHARRRIARPAGPRTCDREQQVLDRIDRARAPPAAGPRRADHHVPRRRAARPPGPWSRRCSWTRSATRCSSRWKTRAQLHLNGAPAGAHHRLLRGLAAVLPRRRHRRPGRQRHGQRPGGVRGATPLYLSCRVHPGGGLPGRRPAAGSWPRWRPPPRPPGCRSSPATPRWSSGARPTAATSTPPASACVEHDVPLGRGERPARGRGDRVRPDRRPRRDDHAGPGRAGHRGRHHLGHRAAERR